jgi:hydroxymethylpyrimidine/phosphomethylpyrimidine kinase
MKRVCERICELGCKCVVLKGAKIGDYIVDLYYDGKLFKKYLSSVSQKHKKVHGTGCMFSALLTGYIAKGYSIEKAVRFAKKITYLSILSSFNIGRGLSVLPTSIDQRFKVTADLKKCVDRLYKILPENLIPNVGINFVYALPDATTLTDVCGVKDRIQTLHEHAEVGFGYSDHMARVVLTTMKFDTRIRSCMNIKYSPQIVSACKKLNFKVKYFSRKDEPPDARTMEWCTSKSIEELGYVPDIIYDLGSPTKEPMVRVLGKNPNDVLRKVSRIIFFS